MKRIVIPEYFPDDFLHQLMANYDVVYDPDLYADRRRLLEEVRTADAIITRNRTQVDSELLGAAPQLRVVGRLGVGLDNIDLPKCAEADVLVIPAHEGNAVSVAEYVIGAMFTLTRDVFNLTEGMVAGSWPRQGYAIGEEVFGKTIGVVGYGAIGRRVGARAKALGMRVLANDPYIPDVSDVWDFTERVTLDELLTSSDFVTVHTPLNDETRDIIDAAELAKMKPRARLINTSRGGTVNERALTDALRAGTIGGAAIDVFTLEPLGVEAAEAFDGLNNVILTPHIAGNTTQSIDRIARMTVDSVVAELGLT